MFRNLNRIKRVNSMMRNVSEQNSSNNKLTDIEISKKIIKKTTVRHSIKLGKYFKTPHLAEVKKRIPAKYFSLKRQYTLTHMYLIDSNIAETIVQHVLPYIQTDSQLVCETAPGLGLITSKLLDNKVKLVRMYESCSEFREGLRGFNEVYPGRVELYIKNIFQLGTISCMDKVDRMNRVEKLLTGVPRKQWNEEPVMTIIGAMPNIAFISYLMKMLATQSEIVALGRVQLFAIMRPGDYIKLSAGPEQNLHTYQIMSVLFNLFFDHRLVEKIPRHAFLPWETENRISSSTRYASIKRIDLDSMYLVKINFKRKLPTDVHNVVSLYYFVRHFFGRGTNRVIPTIEKLIPGCGLNLIVPALHHTNYYKNMNIFTIFGELTPIEILALFKEVMNHPSYQDSSFAAMVESQLLKSETRETLINDEMPFNSEMIDDLEEKLNLWNIDDNKVD